MNTKSNSRIISQSLHDKQLLTRASQISSFSTFPCHLLILPNSPHILNFVMHRVIAVRSLQFSEQREAHNRSIIEQQFKHYKNRGEKDDDYDDSFEDTHKTYTESPNKNIQSTSGDNGASSNKSTSSSRVNSATHSHGHKSNQRRRSSITDNNDDPTHTDPTTHTTSTSTSTASTNTTSTNSTLSPSFAHRKLHVVIHEKPDRTNTSTSTSTSTSHPTSTPNLNSATFTHKKTHIIPFTAKPTTYTTSTLSYT